MTLAHRGGGNLIQQDGDGLVCVVVEEFVDGGTMFVRALCVNDDLRMYECTSVQAHHVYQSQTITLVL